MRVWIVISTMLLVSAFGACSRRESSRDYRYPEDQNSAAYKAGRAAHGIAKETGHVAKKAGEKIGEAARKMGEGWREASREDRAKQNR